MPRVSRAPELRYLSDDVLRDLLASACASLARSRAQDAREFRSAVIALEIELARRGVCDDAPVEPRFSLGQLQRGPRHARIAARRMKAAVRANDPAAYCEALIMLDAENYGTAYDLAHHFQRDAVAFSKVLEQVFLWIAAAKYDFDLAVAAVRDALKGLTREQAVLQLIANIERVLREDGEGCG
jgi:hypothetical protein